jgi:hypothetical protein
MWKRRISNPFSYYWFVEGQLNILKTTENVCFANILDGDEAV